MTACKTIALPLETVAVAPMIALLEKEITFQLLQVQKYHFPVLDEKRIYEARKKIYDELQEKRAFYSKLLACL